jgi:NADH-quinone oxidoreductase subunit J
MALVTTAIVSGRDVLKFKGEGVKTATLEDPDGNIRQIARSIFGDYVVAFEVTSVLLVVAVVGTVVLTRKRKSEKVES